VNVDRVLFDGTTATGVRAADGTEYRGREVILCGGTYGSPAILLRSGIGPAADLTALGIPVVADLPVGRRLQDQVGYYNAYALAPGHLEMTPAVGSLLWTASSEAVGDELDLHVTATHLMDGSFSPTGGAIVLMAALVQPESAGTLKLAPGSRRGPAHRRQLPRHRSRRPPHARRRQARTRHRPQPGLRAVRRGGDGPR
jgi:choline dehydrogenase